MKSHYVCPETNRTPVCGGAFRCARDGVCAGTCAGKHHSSATVQHTLPGEQRVFDATYHGKTNQYLKGYAVMWSTPSTVHTADSTSTYREQFRRGCFGEFLEQNTEVAAYANHHQGLTRLLGLRSDGRLRLREDDTGLRVELDLDTHAQHVLDDLFGGALNGWSVHFTRSSILDDPDCEMWLDSEDGGANILQICRASLREVSVCVGVDHTPAHQTTIERWAADHEALSIIRYAAVGAYLGELNAPLVQRCILKEHRIRFDSRPGAN